jgi:hypothetical protein
MAKAASSKKSKVHLRDETALQRLHTWNIWLACIHAAQAIAIFIASTSYTLPVIASYLAVDPINSAVAGHTVLSSATRQLFQFNLVDLVVAFFLVSAIAHGLAATVYRARYEADLEKGINRLRWFEYAISAGLMIVGIGFLSGVYDISSLFMLFAFVVVMNLLGLAMEVYNAGKRQPNWLCYWIGCIAGIVPWLVFAGYLIVANVYGSGHVPTFVYWIYGTMFVSFNSFAVNMYLQYKKKGKWADYLYGEQGYMILNLVAKTLLAWQVFFGVLRP